MGPKVKAVLEMLKAGGENGVAKVKLQEITKGTNSAILNNIHVLREEGYKIETKSGLYFYKGKTDESQLVRPHKKGKTKNASDVMDSLIDQSTRQSNAPASFDITRMLASKDLIEDLNRLSEQDRRDFLAHAKQALFYWKSAINVLQSNKSMREFAKEIGITPDDIA